MTSFNTEDGTFLAREIADALHVDPDHPGTRRLASALASLEQGDVKTEAAPVDMDVCVCRSLVRTQGRGTDSSATPSGSAGESCEAAAQARA